ncbi:MAG: hypothetical protein WEB03_00790 [Nitriliruptor sp.]|uniref:hypothetical protein n=1 Tax=Nitriliruptor sp. TaxID=2448056 RepID=UPI0034A00BC7
MSDDAPATERSTARIEVVGGGTVGAEQLAAVVVALTPSGADDPSGDTAAPAWARAALLEGVGLLPPTRPSDLQQVTVLGH